MIKMTEAKRELFKRYDNWAKRVAKGCKELRPAPYVGMPTPLPSCALTGQSCRIDTCPKVENNDS